jgi:4-hydroxybenzoate polyprenyltransferase
METVKIIAYVLLLMYFVYKAALAIYVINSKKKMEEAKKIGFNSMQYKLGLVEHFLMIGLINLIYFL